MRKEYNVKDINPRKNPYVRELKKQVTIKLKPSTITFSRTNLEKQEFLIKL